MPVKIRLQRHGKKGKPFFWIVAADSRSKRDGKFLEKLGIYNPNTNPATIEVNVDNSVKWLQNGAQPTDTARAILSYKGVLLKKHLSEGVTKGALTEEQAEAKFNTWLDEKANAVDNKKNKLASVKDQAKAEALKAEKAVNEARIAAAQPVEEVVEEAVAEVETPAEEIVAEETVAEETATEETATEETATEETAAEETAVVETEAAPAEEAPAVVAEEAAKEEE